MAGGIRGGRGRQAHQNNTRETGVWVAGGIRQRERESKAHQSNTGKRGRGSGWNERARERQQQGLYGERQFRLTVRDGDRDRDRK